MSDDLKNRQTTAMPSCVDLDDMVEDDETTAREEDEGDDVEKRGADTKAAGAASSSLTNKSKKSLQESAAQTSTQVVCFTCRCLKWLIVISVVLAFLIAVGLAVWIYAIRNEPSAQLASCGSCHCIPSRREQQQYLPTQTAHRLFARSNQRSQGSNTLESIYTRLRSLQ